MLRINFIIIFIVFTGLALNGQDLSTYTPKWIEEGVVDAGASHEPWMFLIRRNRDDFNLWKKEAYDYRLTEEYIKSLAESGVTMYHIFGYKGYGFEAELEHLRKAVKAAKTAHKYGLKVNTYVQWNTMVYETFFNEEPKAKSEQWYQMDINGRPIMLHYGYQQSFRYRPCFNNKDYMDYFKEKILSYIVDSVKSDFIHLDNFVMAHPAEADHNPATITAFREYLKNKYKTKEKRYERFGIDDLSQILPPMWNRSNRAENIVEINDPVIQEWIDFRCWSQSEHVAECARYVRQKNKEIAIEVNPHGLTGYNIIWELAINHPDLANYTNAFVTEEPNYIKYENNVCTGKFRTYKMGRTTGNLIFTIQHSENGLAESLAFNKTLGGYNLKMSSPDSKKYLTYWNQNKDIYLNCTGAEKVAVLRSYCSMAYNTLHTHYSVNMAEQALQQSQIPFDIIFDQQLDNIQKYDAIILPNQESLSDEAIEKIKNYVKNGGGLVITGNTAKYNQWRRLRKVNGFTEVFNSHSFNSGEPSTVHYGKGRAIYIPELVKPNAELVNPNNEPELGFATQWRMPLNNSEFKSAVIWTSAKKSPLIVSAPEWIGVAHDIKKDRDIIHLVSYNKTRKTTGITLQLNGQIRNAKAVSPDFKGEKTLTFTQNKDECLIHIPELEVYQAIVIER